MIIRHFIIYPAMDEWKEPDHRQYAGLSLGLTRPATRFQPALQEKLTPIQNFKTETVAVLVVGIVEFTEGGLPLIRLVIGKVGVAVDFRVDVGQV